MPTRYEQLRQAIAVLGAPAPEQASYLDELMAPVTGGGSAAAYGNDELALGLDDIFHASKDMIWHGELTDAEAALIRPLDDLLTQLSGKHNADFWRREALDADARWDDVRALARSALSGLTDEERAVGRCARNGS
jgi:hypothetical protein